jgi:tRNA(fMet)-specific endonuclease VapC
MPPERNLPDCECRNMDYTVDTNVLLDYLNGKKNFSESCSYVIDTDVAIDYMKGAKDVVDLLDSLPELFISSVTVAELFYGAYNSSLPEKRVAGVIKFLDSLYILEMDFLASRIFGKIKADLRRCGKEVGDFDLLIAGTCIANQCTLITRNLRHYQSIEGLSVKAI